MQRELLISERLYSALLNLYPPTFRAMHGQQMRLTFRDACRDAYRRRGLLSLLALWLPTLLDLFKSALEERARQGELTMSKERLMTLSGKLATFYLMQKYRPCSRPCGLDKIRCSASQSFRMLFQL